MRHHVADVNLAGSIMNVGGQTILVSGDVEDGELTNRIRVWIGLTYIDDTGPPQPFGCPVPVVERRLRVLVSVGELAKGFAANDTRACICSQTESALVKRASEPVAVATRAGRVD